MNQLDAYQFRMFFACLAFVVTLFGLFWHVARLMGRVDRLEDQMNTQRRVNAEFNEEIKKLKEPKP